MDVLTAMALIGDIVYRPGWTIEAEDLTKRFEATISLHFEYPAQNTDREQAPQYMEQIMARASFPIVVYDLDHVGLYREVMQSILTIEEHEAREYFRVGKTLWAPFHPHNVGGMMRWGAGVERDLKFGIG